MKKIINDKLYDTEKAKLVLNFYRKTNVNYIFGTYKEWVKGELYVTSKGNWFEVIGRDMKGTQLNALTENEAKSIIKNCDIDLYVKMYSNVEDA